MIRYFSIPVQDIITYSNNLVINNKLMVKLDITNLYDVYAYFLLGAENTCNIKQIYDNTGYSYRFHIRLVGPKYELYFLLNDNVTDLNFILEFDELDNPVISYDYVDFNALIEQYDGTLINIISTLFDSPQYNYLYFSPALNGTIIDLQDGLCIFEKKNKLSLQYFDGIYTEHSIELIDDIYNLYFYVQGNVVDHTGYIVSNKKLLINIRKIGLRYYARLLFVESLLELELELWLYDTDSTLFTFEFIIHSTSVELKINHIQLYLSDSIFQIGEVFALDNFYIRLELDSGLGRFTKLNYIDAKFYDIYYYSLSYVFGRFLMLPALAIDDPDISILEDFITGNILLKFPILNIKLLYKYDFTDIINESYILDLLYKNYIITYSSGITIFDRFEIDWELMDLQKDFFYRQLTPYFVLDETIDNKNKLFSLFLESMLLFINKSEQLMYRYGDLFNPYDSDVYLKRTFYMYLLDIDIFDEFSFKIELNTQIYLLLSLEFFKTLQKNYVNRGIIENIDDLLDNSFKNLLSILQLYLIIFNETYGVHINSYLSALNLKDFYSYCKDGGIQIIFEKLKLEMYKKYEEYIGNIYGEISKFYHLNYKIDNQDVIDNIKTDVVDDLLLKLVYRLLVIVYDSYLMRTVNIKNLLIQFMDFIYKQYLPINMEVIFIDLLQLSSDLTTDRLKQYDFVHFTFNSLEISGETIRSIYN